MKKRVCAVLLGTVLTCHASLTYGAVQDYETVTEADHKADKAIQVFETEDGSGNTVKVAAVQDSLYVSAKSAGIYSKPGEGSDKLADVGLGDILERTAVCDNGWSKVSCETDEGNVIGYIQNQMLSENDEVQAADEEAEVISDTTVLDYPSKKDGEEVGEVLEMDQVRQTGTVDEVWSRITYQNADGSEAEGYIPTSCLNLSDTETAGEDTIDTDKDAGTLHEGSGEGVFADALEEAAPDVTEQNGVQIGTPVAASSDANLQDLGVFKITHYCPCSICCGPYANGITSTGVTATTNHTIAVDPTVIPYGSKVVINGQVYVAEDCGGAIKKNRIDIYVATHAEGEAKGTYNTEVYLIK
ncbi:3D domain-containing protein [Blautia sp. MSJ-19]|uniref:3D domain-containing protein n=1 Tax=Blautia sp. MSJ-19 TaxID=2841517 RepID=UPI001C0EAF38|nr:3D domain-containing protein [Blautia sp. MSJ-19]MBU5481627.1 3D domain-containing protein [Blautia sp. MSJ-19]